MGKICYLTSVKNIFGRMAPVNEMRRAVTWDDVLKMLPGADEKTIKAYYTEQAIKIIKEYGPEVDVVESLALLYLSGIFHGTETTKRLQNAN
jgi:hypothetical protein